MIPKKIHYCWLSEDPIPSHLKGYIDAWKVVLPDYEFKLWNKSEFNINSVEWVKEAYSMRKWAFAADYIRVYALYTEGGFYLDSDVILNKSLDDYLDYGFVSSIERVPSKNLDCAIDENFRRKSGVEYVRGLAVQAAIIGAEKGHVFLKKLLDYYESNHFIKEDDSLNNVPCPNIYSKFLEDYGFLYKDEEQNLQKKVKIFDSTVFASYQTCKFGSVAIHMCEGSWTNKKDNSFVGMLKKSLFIRKIYNQIRCWF